MYNPFARHKLRDGAGQNAAIFRRSLVILCLGGLMLPGAVRGSAETDAASEPRPTDLAARLPSCVAESAGQVDLVSRTADGVFLDAAGRGYFAAGVSPFDAEWPEDDTAYAAAPGGPVRLQAIPLGEPNRWGWVPAWIVRDTGGDKHLLQVELLERGGALFMPDSGSRPCADLLWTAERKAQRARSGIWTGPAGTKVLSAAKPASFEGKTGHVVVARGRIVSLGKTRSTRYLNFGRHWKTDFTVTLKSSDEDAFNQRLVESGWQIEDLTGRFVEVRGVLQEWDGPHIALRHPEQLVVLEYKRAEGGGQDNN